MSYTAISHLEKIYDQNRSFELGNTLSKGYEIWKKDMWSYLGFFILYMIIVGTLSAIPVAGQLATSILVGPALTLGAAIFAYRLYSRDNAEFSNFFDGFAHWQQISILGLITGVISILLLSPIIFSFGWSLISGGAAEVIANGGLEDIDIDSISKAMIAISVLLLIYFTICISFAVHFIGFFELDAINALKYSFMFVNRQWIWIFLFMIAAGLISCIGFILLFVGILLTLPMIYTMQYAAFDELTAVAEYFDSPSDVTDINVDEMFG